MSAPVILPYRIGRAAWFVLIALQLLWHGWLARPEHLPTWLVLAVTVVPLLLPFAALPDLRRALLWVGILSLFYFCHGVAEELIHSLARVPGLRVISRTSAFAFQGQGADITEIGRRLNAESALEGSVRRSGSRVRISARLVNTADGFQLWSKRFDRELEDVFAIEDEIAETIVNDLASEVASTDGTVLALMHVPAVHQIRSGALAGIGGK